MAITRLIAEGVGPFERLDLDFSDGNGNPHLGPHIIAGVNGAGKSTLLRSIAWVLERDGDGFPREEWDHIARPQTRVEVQFQGGSGTIRTRKGRLSQPPFGLMRAAYAPSRSIASLGVIDMGNPAQQDTANALGFHSAVSNAGVQSWILSAFTRSALAASRGAPVNGQDQPTTRLESALNEIFGEEVHLDVNIDAPIPYPRILMRDQTLNFSQIPDGVRNVLGWLADFMRREAIARTTKGVLIIDEVDAHLHPRWQRQVLPALRAALPEVQIIVTTHSPFVISSCREARVHVLEVDEQGVAHARPPIDAPFGQSINATMKDIFDVDSRFDVRTERELKKWNELKRREAVGKLDDAGRSELVELTNSLSDRSEELKMIVGLPLEPARR